MLVKYDGVQRLRRVTRARDAEVLVCPAVVYELLRTRDSARRNAQVKAATLGAWTRMRTEVYIECNDFRSVAAARRPSWFHAEPDLRAYHALRADWSAGGWFWRRARHDTAAEARRLAGLEGDLLARPREEAQKRREGMGAVHFDSVPQTVARRAEGLNARLGGWDGRHVAPHVRRPVVVRARRRPTHALPRHPTAPTRG
jgi:hypothetical protein